VPKVERTWRCPERPGIALPDVGPRALVERAAALDDMGEYTRTRERLHGTPDSGVRFEEVEWCSTDAAGPSPSASTRIVTVVGLRANTNLEIRVAITPSPFRSAGFVATASIEAPDDAAVTAALTRLDREFGEARQL